MFSRSWNLSGQQMPRTYWETYIAKYPVAANPGWHHHFIVVLTTMVHLKNCNNKPAFRNLERISQNGRNWKNRLQKFSFTRATPTNTKTTRYMARVNLKGRERKPQVGRLADPPYEATVPLASTKKDDVDFSRGFSLKHMFFWVLPKNRKSG